jgi:hypothetical protein
LPISSPADQRLEGDRRERRPRRLLDLLEDAPQPFLLHLRVRRLERRDDVEERHPVGRAGEVVPAPRPPLPGGEPRPREVLQDLRDDRRRELVGLR